MSAPIRRRRPELRVQREILRELGRAPHTLIGLNTLQGLVYTQAALHAVTAALRPFGREVVAAAVSALTRHRARAGVGGEGAPDLLVCSRGRAIGLEVKAEDGVVSEVQRQWHAAARARSLPVMVVRSPADAVAALQRVERGEVE
jgi:hypothetical protein